MQFCAGPRLVISVYYTVIGISMGMSPRGCGALNSAPYYVPMVRYARAPRFCGMMSHSHLSATAPQLKRP
jgi:hypothetical protein